MKADSRQQMDEIRQTTAMIADKSDSRKAQTRFFSVKLSQIVNINIALAFSASLIPSSHVKY
jgi:hypothetical protein